MPKSPKATVQHRVNDVVYCLPTTDEPGALGVIASITKNGHLHVQLDGADDLVDVLPEDVKTPTAKQLASRTPSTTTTEDPPMPVTTKKATKAQRQAAEAKAIQRQDRVSKAQKTTKATKKAAPAETTLAKATTKAPKQIKREEISTHQAIGIEGRVSLPQSVGQQILHCLRVAIKGGADKTALAPRQKEAQRLATTGALAETKLRALRDVLREHQPEPEDNEVEWVLTQRACRGIGMVIARQAAAGEAEEE